MRLYFNRDEELSTSIDKLFQKKLDVGENGLTEEVFKYITEILHPSIVENIKSAEDDSLLNEVIEEDNILAYTEHEEGENHIGYSKTSYLAINIENQYVALIIYSTNMDDYGSFGDEVYFDEVVIIKKEDFTSELNRIDSLEKEVNKNKEIQAENYRKENLEREERNRIAREEYELEVKNSPNLLTEPSKKKILFLRQLKQPLSKKYPELLFLLKSKFPELVNLVLIHETIDSLELHYTFVNNKETGRKKTNILRIFKLYKDKSIKVKCHTKTKFTTLKFQTLFWEEFLQYVYDEDLDKFRSLEKIKEDEKEKDRIREEKLNESLRQMFSMF